MTIYMDELSIFRMILKLLYMKLFGWRLDDEEENPDELDEGFGDEDFEGDWEEEGENKKKKKKKPGEDDEDLEEDWFEEDEEEELWDEEEEEIPDDY